VPDLLVIEGDITAQTVDAIVNAANERLAAGGGVCGAVFAAAGPGLAGACAPLAPCPTGEARATPGFALPARWIVHAVGPVWSGGTAGEPELLDAAYRSALTLAADLGARSIAFPAISTGIYGYPIEPATRIALRAGRDAPEEIDEVRYVCFDAPTAELYRRELTGLGG
jgi:O-acetyl-ADP-ribose deacetylase (regulator of RNase III)